MNYHIMFEIFTIGGHMSVVTCVSLSQRCQWLSPITQTKLTTVHISTLELVLASVAACIKTPALPQTW